MIMMAQRREGSTGSVSSDMGGSRAGAPVVRIIQILKAGYRGGRELLNLELAARLDALALDTQITVVGEGSYEPIPAQYSGVVEIEQVLRRDGEPISLVEWNRILRDRPARIAVIASGWPDEPTLPMLAAARINYPRVIVHRHSEIPPMPPPATMRFLGGALPRPGTWRTRERLRGRLFSALAARTICVGERARHRLIEHYGYHPDRTVTVHNGIDCNRFRFDAQARTRFRHRFGIGEEAIVFGAVGRIENAVKRHDISLRAFARLVREHPEPGLHFLLVGDGPDREEMIRLASTLEISDRVTIAPYSAEPWEAYSALDVFLMPSASEGFGLAMVEAMATERCVITMATGGASEILAQPGLGYLVPLDDTEGFFAAMVEVLRSGSAGRQAIGTRARAWVQERFDADRRFEELIAQICGHCTGRSQIPAP